MTTRGTRLQEKLAKAIVSEDPNARPKTAGELLDSVGYAKTTQKKRPGDILRRKGVRDELKILGFSEVEVDSVVSQILHNKEVEPATRLNAADKVYKRLGSYSPEKHISLNLNIDAEAREKSRKAIRAFAD